ncbi:hypothetical protein KKF29_00230 [Patescibacteria group bacterium]|nr:hypothetical protein [Patescibacteria group bacterium]
MKQIQLSPEIQNKIIEEWNEIVKKYGDYPSEPKKIAWVEFSGKIEKEYGLMAWQVWELVRAKKVNNKEASKWYKKSINIVAERNFISVLSFISSLFFYIIQKISNSENAKFISIFLFSIGIGEYVGDKIGEKYSSKNISSISSLFLIIVSIIFLIVGGSNKEIEFIYSSLIGVGFGVSSGFELKKMRIKNLID